MRPLQNIDVQHPPVDVHRYDVVGVGDGLETRVDQRLVQVQHLRERHGQPQPSAPTVSVNRPCACPGRPKRGRGACMQRLHRTRVFFFRSISCAGADDAVGVARPALALRGDGHAPGNPARGAGRRRRRGGEDQARPPGCHVDRVNDGVGRGRGRGRGLQVPIVVRREVPHAPGLGVGSRGVDQIADGGLRGHGHGDVRLRLAVRVQCAVAPELGLRGVAIELRVCGWRSAVLSASRSGYPNAQARPGARLTIAVAVVPVVVPSPLRPRHEAAQHAGKPSLVAILTRTFHLPLLQPFGPLPGPGPDRSSTCATTCGRGGAE